MINHCPSMFNGRWLELLDPSAVKLHGAMKGKFRGIFLSQNGA
jgi:hypothetical protein